MGRNPKRPFKYEELQVIEEPDKIEYPPDGFMRKYGVSAGKRDQIEIFFKKKFLSKIDVDLIIWSRTFVISKKIFLSIWSLFPALTPSVVHL